MNSEDYPDAVNTPTPEIIETTVMPADGPNQGETSDETPEPEQEEAKPASKPAGSIFGAKPDQSEKPAEEEKPKSEPVSRNSIFSKVSLT